MPGNTAADPRRELLLVVGTRPEAVKLAPLVWALREHDDVRATVVVTAQHRDLTVPLLDLLDIDGAELLDRPAPGLPLTTALAQTVDVLGERLRRTRPAIVVVQGDTTAALAGALAGFHERIPVAHVEAGLRTGDPEQPFPEETHRRLIASLATVHFAPTAIARDHLLAEGIDPARVHVTGNTVVDALVALRGAAPVPTDDSRARLVVATVHRRESWGAPLERIAAALRDIADARPDVELVVPVHPNPLVAEPLVAALAGRPNVQLLAPLPYDAFLALLARADLVLTDSGGVQEEAPSFGTPVLLLRERTERPEAVTAGFVQVVGTDRTAIAAAALAVLAAPPARTDGKNPFGDGRAAPRIADALRALAGGRISDASVV